MPGNLGNILSLFADILNQHGNYEITGGHHVRDRVLPKLHGMLILERQSHVRWPKVNDAWL